NALILVFLSLTAKADYWTQKANFGGGNRAYAVGFSIDNKGYAGLGPGAGAQNDFWEFDPAVNSWTQKANFPGGTPRYGAIGVSMGTKGYIGTGTSVAQTFNDFWEWDQATNVWVQKANFGGGT